MGRIFKTNQNVLTTMSKNEEKQSGGSIPLNITVTVPGLDDLIEGLNQLVAVLANNTTIGTTVSITDLQLPSADPAEEGEPEPKTKKKKAKAEASKAEVETKAPKVEVETEAPKAEVETEAPKAEPEPEPEAPIPTIEELQNVTKKKVSNGFKGEIIGELRARGVEKVSEVPEEERADFLSFLNGLSK